MFVTHYAEPIPGSRWGARLCRRTHWPMAPQDRVTPEKSKVDCRECLELMHA